MSISFWETTRFRDIVDVIVRKSQWACAWVDYNSFSIMMSVTSWYLLQTHACPCYMLIILAYEKLAFRKTTNLAVEPCIIILSSHLGCLRVHSMYSLACHWLFYWPGMREQVMMKISWWRACELGRFPVRMPVGLRQMAWVHVVVEDFRCDDIIKTWPLWSYLCNTVCKDVRLLLFSFCVFSEHWSLGSLYMCIRWSRLMSRGPHNYNV